MIDESGTTVRLPEHLLLEAKAAAQDRGESFNRFIAWVIRQALCLEFLSPENLTFVLQIADELGRPWSASRTGSNELAAVNLLVSYARGDARARKLLDLFFARNDSFRAIPILGEPKPSAEQLPLDFSQKQRQNDVGEVSPSPKKADAPPPAPLARAKGAGRG